MVVTVEGMEKSLSELEDMLIKLPIHIERLEQQIDLCQQELTDIQHKIELTNFNAHEGWKLAKDIQLTLQARRVAKDELKGLEDIQKRFTKHSPFGTHIKASSRDIAIHKNRLANRRYRLRIRRDFLGTFENTVSKKEVRAK